jgi:hypothetical protein
LSDKPRDPFAGFPRLHEIVAAGVPAADAIAMWNRMTAQLDRGADYWWNEVRRGARSSQSLQ